MNKFVSGLKLSGLFYEEGVRLILEEGFPELPYSAGLIGFGSENLSYDTQRSTDRVWGPRLLLFLAEENTKRTQRTSPIASAGSCPTVHGLLDALRGARRGRRETARGEDLRANRSQGGSAHSSSFSAWMGLDPFEV